MTSLQAMSDAAHAAHAEALFHGDILRAHRLGRIATLAARELDGTAHHPNCECNRCFDKMGDDNA